MNTMNNTIAVKALGLQQTWPPASLLRVNPLAAVVVAGMLALLCLQACTSGNKLLANGEPYEVLAPDGRYVFVSSPKYIKEMDSAPDTVLSLQAAAKQMLQPIHTMHAFNWFDRRGTEGVGFVKALRTMLTNNLPAVLPDLSTIIRTRFESLHEAHPKINGVTQSPVYVMNVKLVVLSNAVSFFGKDLGMANPYHMAHPTRLIPVTMLTIIMTAKNEAFMESALTYIEETFVCAEIVRLLPKFMSPILGRLMRRRLKSQDVVYNTLLAVTEQRCLERDMKNLGQDVPYHIYALDAAAHNNLVANETQTAESTRRAALRPFTFSDGTKLNVGDWGCTPVKAMMHDAEFYPEPLQFNGFRFADPAIVQAAGDHFKTPQPKPSKLTDCSSTYHVWGTGRMACPGRYYATAVMKVILGQIIMNYHCELLNREESRCVTWRSTMLPKHSTKVVFTRRAD
ncbi:hypothetical protein CHGG_09834 [Chaetomium globosum CBS 148.51]|uniref:Cytochrome P450 n=1 Tax=Chaetomium globosum (strain ATCC 6205 / CBS 148.51 / DSM 1962 / NBRC 6347 / NRRL 1970) TaxID=306901 RepID=Q2GQC0_CHAGB|nr:uncharacterized protein CHGG_09834 [Chaetomium globosum CBS 148.51]EAQ83430.1 hypothetical protein CHGG_09834 [Chaetomium globosum CBS 148.51]